MDSYKETIDAIMLLDAKERMLNEIIVWLKTKGLIEEINQSLSIKIGGNKPSYICKECHAKQKGIADDCAICGKKLRKDEL